MPLKLTFSSPDASAKLVEFILGMRSAEGQDGGKYLVDLLNETSWGNLDASGRGWTVALSNNTAPVADADAIGGNVARIDGASGNVGVMLRRARLSRTTKVDSLRGWERAFVRLKATASSQWEIQLRWATSLADPVNETNDVILLDSLATFGYYLEQDVGYVKIPQDNSESLGGVVVEVWARRLTGAGNLNLDVVRLLPATPGKDLLTRIVVPAGASESWLGRELVTPATPTGLVAGSISGDFLALDAVNEAGGVVPNTGLQLPAGRHRFTFLVDYGTGPTGAPLNAWALRVRNITDNSDVATRTLFAGSLAVSGYTVSLEFDIPSGTHAQTDLYQAQAVVTANRASPNNTTFTVRQVGHSFIPAIGQNEQIATDPDRGKVHKLDANGDVLQKLSIEGPTPFWIPPGLAVMVVLPLDAPPAADALPESVKARTLTFAGKGAPRVFL
jgi:hypothetical protein